MRASLAAAACLALVLAAGPALADTVGDGTVIDLDVVGTSTPTSTPAPTPAPGGAPLPTTELTIFGISVVQLGPTEVTLSWGTSRAATTELRYGRTNLYELGHLSRDLAPALAHQLTITGLQPQTVYHVQVVARDGDGFMAQSGDYVFITGELPDTAPPPNVSALRIVAGDAQLQLTWVNPDAVDFAGVVVVRRDGRAPASPDDGTVVARLRDDYLLDVGLENGRRYFYGIFAFDRFGNFASGALGSGVPLAPRPGEPPVVPGLPPPVVPQYPPVRPEEQLGRDAVAFFANGHTLELAEDSDSRAVIASGYPFEVALLTAGIRKAVQRVAAELQVGLQPEGTEVFWMQLREDVRAYIVGLSLPLPAGSYPVAVYVQYEDGTQDTIRRTLRLESRGTVRDVSSNQPLPDAVVVLWRTGGAGWEVWSPSPGTAINPQLTDANGSYAYVVPPGRYRLEVLRAGYRRLVQEVDSPYGVVATPLELEPEAAAARATSQILNLVIAVLLLLVGWLTRRLLRRSAERSNDRPQAPPPS